MSEPAGRQGELLMFESIVLEVRKKHMQGLAEADMRELAIHQG